MKIEEVWESPTTPAIKKGDIITIIERGDPVGIALHAIVRSLRGSELDVTYFGSGEKDSVSFITHDIKRLPTGSCLVLTQN